MDMFVVLVWTEVYAIEISWIFMSAYMLEEIAIISTSDIADAFSAEGDSIFFTHLKNLSISEPSDEYVEF